MASFFSFTENDTKTQLKDYKKIRKMSTRSRNSLLGGETNLNEFMIIIILYEFCKIII